MQFKSNNRYRRKSTQGLRSLGESLPKIVRDKIIKKSDTYAKLLNNWDKLADNEIHKFCKPESITNIGDSSIKILNIKVTPGKEVDVEYARDDIIKNINIFFGKKIVNKIKIKK
ncbi:DUF721 domain-containing protein [Candidatus Pelagibacter sp.]|nr:DUF721 domain-containing protein [Candidatus Pelagibacter sp.]